LRRGAGERLDCHSIHSIALPVRCLGRATVRGKSLRVSLRLPLLGGELGLRDAPEGGIARHIGIVDGRCGLVGRIHPGTGIRSIAHSGRRPHAIRNGNAAG
jgi:hypothetical protein